MLRSRRDVTLTPISEDGTAAGARVSVESVAQIQTRKWEGAVSNHRCHDPEPKVIVDVWWLRTDLLSHKAEVRQ